MSQYSPNFSTNQLSQSVETTANKFSLFLSRHWLAFANTFFFLYAGLPFAAPLLLANGQTGVANGIYWVYHNLCHLLPSRAYFVAGEQVCLCHRCLAIYASIFLGGIIFGFVRYTLKPLPPKWYLLFLMPMALDGGMGLASELLQFIPIIALWIVGLLVVGLVGGLLYQQKLLNWQLAVVLACIPLALLYLTFIGPHQSNIYLRHITGFLFGIGTVWVAYPLLQEGFGDIEQDAGTKLRVN
jgi:uncharacterized membrane protein